MKIVSDPAMSRAIPPNSRRIHRHTSATPSGRAAPFDGDLHHLQVPAGAESGTGASQDDGADVGIGVERLQRPPQLTHQRSGKHVEPVGFVERDHRSVAAMIDVDPFGRIRVVAGRNDCAVHGIHRAPGLLLNIVGAQHRPRGGREGFDSVPWHLGFAARDPVTAVLLCRAEPERGCDPKAHRPQHSVGVVRTPPVPDGGEEAPIGVAQRRTVEPVTEQQPGLATVLGHPPQVIRHAAADAAFRGVVVAQHRRRTPLGTR